MGGRIVVRRSRGWYGVAGFLAGTGLGALTVALKGTVLYPGPVLAPIAHGVIGAAFGLALHAAVDSRRRMFRSYSGSLNALANAVAAKDDETNGHCKRVVQYSLLMGRRMGLSKRLLQQLEWGALLHDIGKIAVPDSILKKPGPLTDDEWVIMKEHAHMGWLMVKDISFLHEGGDVVLSHHERWDGRGYPNEYRGEEIPLLARIFAIADTFDAITSDRPYRAARPISFAREEIEKYKGTQFCPKCVEVFLQIPESDLERVQEEAKILDYEALQLQKFKHIS